MTETFTETSFNEVIDDLIINIEDQIDELSTDVDYETTAGILTLTMPNNSQIIINRQTSQFQLWLAAKSGGFHFEFNDNSWLDTKTNKDFYQTLNECVFQQSGQQLLLTA